MDNPVRCPYSNAVILSSYIGFLSQGMQFYIQAHQENRQIMNFKWLYRYCPHFLLYDVKRIQSTRGENCVRLQKKMCGSIQHYSVKRFF